MISFLQVYPPRPYTCHTHDKVKINCWKLLRNETLKKISVSRMSPHFFKDTFLCKYTYSMVHSPSWEANWFEASQEIPRISRNPKVHFRTNKRPPPVSILGQPNPVHIPTSHLLEIHPNIIHPSTPRSPQWSFFPPVSPATICNKMPLRVPFLLGMKLWVLCLTLWRLTTPIGVVPHR